jgi:hypothetical protein
MNRKLFCLPVIAVLLTLTSCSKNPSDLACSVWLDQKIEAGNLVDYWAELSIARKLTREEESQAYKDQNLFLSVLSEMNKMGCK